MLGERFEVEELSEYKLPIFVLKLEGKPEWIAGRVFRLRRPR
jgi:hypothetical protein